MDEVHASNSYREAISKAYIDPIRTVIAVDDEFPTMDAMLSTGLGDEKYCWEGKPEDADRVRKLLSQSRANQWMFDVHNGDGIEVLGNGEIDLKHLHQTDLLILDYQLADDGEKSRQVLNQLAQNKHFNIAIVYTNEETSTVFEDLLLSLLYPIRFIADSERDEIAYDLSEWDEIEDGLIASFMNAIELSTYFECHRLKKIDSGNLKTIKLIKDYIYEKFGEKPVEIKNLKAEQVARFLLDKFQSKIIGRLSQKVVGKVKWNNSTADAASNWLKTDSLFLTVVSKKVEADELIQELQSALHQWHPTPHRLLVSYLRNDLEEISGMVEDAALSNKYIQAGLLKSILSEDNDAKRRVELIETISFLWSELLDELKERVLPIAEEMFQEELARQNGDVRQAVLSHIKLDINDKETSEKIALNLNAYRCSIAPGGDHLTTGHILLIEGEHFVCLTPACDLVPGQRTEGWYEKLGRYLPIKLVKISPATPVSALKAAVQGRHLFLDIDENFPRTFCFSNIEPANPEWEQVFAFDLGEFGKGGTLKIGRVAVSEEGETLEITEHNAVVIAQLRYEYALNLLHRLGSNLSRVGLDFVNP